jgi:hypothetical protein
MGRPADNHLEEGTRRRLLAMLDGYRLSQAIAVAAELGVFDAVGESGLSSDALAKRCGAHPTFLERVLRSLAAAGLMRRDSQHRYHLLELGDALRSGHAASLQPWAVFSLTLYRGWSSLQNALKTGQGGTAGRWAALERSDEETRIFDLAMHANAAWIARGLASAWDFSPYGTVVDVGGGDGTLIESILSANAATRGVLLERPQAIAHADERLRRAGLLGRCQLQAGSFLDDVPGGGDLYLLSRVLHDWDDPGAVAILGKVRDAMRIGAPLLVIERVLHDEHPALEDALSDLNMLVMNGGQERTAGEFRSLIEAAGFRLEEIIATSLPVRILHAVAS